MAAKAELGEFVRQQVSMDTGRSDGDFLAKVNQLVGDHCSRTPFRHSQGGTGSASRHKPTRLALASVSESS